VHDRLFLQGGVGVTTYRERREARAERLRDWAEKRETKAAAVFEANRPYTSDYAFNTQPGHIPVRARIIAQEDRAHESVRKAQSMASRADSIDAQLDGSIYSDDPDAVERLTERVAGLEAERDRVKAFNATCRKGAPDWSLITAAEKRNLLRTAEVAAYSVTDKAGKFKGFPSYHLTNLSGNIARQRKRLESLERKAS
jgi:hypothetical protein